MKKDIQQQLDELGILNIEANGYLSRSILESAIASSKKLLTQLDIDKIADEIDAKEKEFAIND